MHTPNGIHHIAICTADMRAQLDFFSDVLGLKLVGLFWMHGVEGTWHAFMKLDEDSFLSFVQTPATPGIPREVGVTHAGQPGGSSSSGTLQHVALNVTDLDSLLALRDRIRSRGVNVFGPLDHGLCHSIYFAGPEDLTLEIATNGTVMTAKEWIDPEVVEVAGISADELERFCDPAPFTAPPNPQAQPEIDPSKPHMRGYPEPIYRKIIETPDDVLSEAMSFNEPPVKKS
jgi:catechol 2,3-dioxygenase-like lactoylglutathione lyase family enzyme